MIRALTAVFLLGAGWSFGGLDLDRLRWNPRERTETGLEALGREDADGALEAFETATALAPGDPRLRYNAGSAHLATAGASERSNPAAAAAHLEAAVETAPSLLRPEAWYNLGNARFAGGDLEGAIAAFEESLRAAPEHDDAKYNLEVALQQQQKQQEQDQEQQEQQEQPAEGEDQEQQEQQQDGEEEREGQSEPEPSEDESPTDDNQSQPQDFEEQPDMTPEQAAAILEAVENMEREQRRQLAEELQKKAAKKGKDW